MNKGTNGRSMNAPPRIIERTLIDLQEDYNQCYKTIRKTYEFLERMGIKTFNKYSKFKWNYDHDRDCNYVCIRFGNSLSRKIFVKSSAYLEEAELYQWIEDKDLICEALEEAYEYIRKKVRVLKIKMEEVKDSIVAFEERFDLLDDEFNAIPPNYKNLEE